MKSLETKGYLEIQNLIPEYTLDKINDQIEKPLNRPMINGKKGYIKKDNFRYLFATLSWGREIIDLYTHPEIIQLIEQYVGDDVHLSNYRIYRAFPSNYEKMNWHVDNKTDSYDEASNRFVTKMVLDDKGVIMIVYLSDVEDGGFQIVEGSHLWSIEEERERWNHKEKYFRDRVVTFNKRKKGTVILYDYRSIHRAKPYRNGKTRTSLFGQYSSSRMPVGEPILLCARDLSNLSDLQKRVLNFGQIPSGENWPIGSIWEMIEEIGVKESVKSFLVSQAKKAAKMLKLWSQ